ncbi:MAG TPA: TonB family protein [Candidatus Sulfotelmatobacter sp.]|nr:TonB family protein [Candidatus Sulfotelmatobacter sp.]
MGKPESWKTWEGQVVEGKFTLRRLLGGTEHTAVFLTELPAVNSPKVAIKLIELQGEDAVHRIAQLRSPTQLSHPHLIRMFEAARCVVDETPLVYAVMEYADEDLSQILPHRALSPGEVSELLPPLLDAVAYLHGLGFVHGRIKPSNVLAVGDQLKLSSDQVMAMAEPNETRRRKDVYDAPETAAGIVSPASDVWSLGVTLVAAITQNVTIAEDTAIGHPTLPETIAEPYRGIVRECLQLDPNRRPSLAQIQARLQPPARSVPHRPEPLPVPPRSVHRRPWLAIALVIFVAVLIGLGVLWSRGKSTSAQNSDATPQPATQAALPASPAREPAATPHEATTPSSGGEVIHQVIPDIPQSAKNTIRGTIKVTVRVDVGSSGKVTSANLKNAGPSRYFAGKALAAAQHWEFSPPLAGGQPAASVWLLQFHFRKTSTQASSQRLAR